MFSFTVPGEPVGKGRPRFAKRGNFVKAYTPEKTANYENWVKSCFLEKYNFGDILSGQIKITISIFMGIPESVSKIRRTAMQYGQIRPTKKPDADNILKAISDSLNTLAYNDDKQIVSVNIEKFYSDNPRVDVVIEEV